MLLIVQWRICMISTPGTLTIVNNLPDPMNSVTVDHTGLRTYVSESFAGGLMARFFSRDLSGQSQIPDSLQVS